jgi:hypothetical protein
MKRGIMVAALAAIGLFAVPSAPAVASVSVPFHGVDRGHFTIPGDCPGGALVVIGGSGTASALGRYAFTSVECFDPGTGTFAGTPTFIAANGDTLTGSYSGTVAGTDDPNVITYDEELTIASGTGRFASTTGAAHVHGVANLATGEYTQWLSGSLSRS